MSISSPTEITAETLEVYYNTSNGGSMTFPSNKLSDITDVTVNNIDAAQAVTDDQPEVGLVLKNGRYVIHFNGVSHHLISAAFSSPLAQPTTIFFYIDRDNNLNSPHVTDGIDATDRQLIYYNETKWRLYAGSSTVEVGDHDAGPNFIIVEFNGSSAKFYADGTLINTVTVSTNALGGLTMGCKYNQTSWFEGKLAQIGVFSGILSAGDRGDLDNWGRREMGLIVPLAPTNLSAVAGDEQVTLTWNETVGKTSYSLWWSLTSPVTESDTEITSVTSGYVHTGRTNGVEVFYKLQALNDSGDGPLSTEDSATPTGSVPDAPTAPSAVSGTGKITIDWTDSAGQTSNNVYRSQSSPVTTDDTKFTGVDDPYDDSTAVNGTLYYYAISAVNGGGESALSTEVSAKAIATAGNPAAVAGTGDNTITWDAVTGSTSYNLYHSTSPITDKLGSKIVGASSGEVHTPLTNNILVYYRVVALNASGESDLSTEVSAKPIAVATSVDAVSGTSKNTITWDAVAGATGYDVYHSTSTITDKLGSKLVDASSGVEHTGLANNVLVYYRVVAKNATGESDLSTEKSGTPLAIPANLVAVPGDASGKNSITWDTVAGAVSYKLYWKVGTVVTKGDSTIPTVTSPYVHTGLDDDVEVSYCVVAVIGSGESDLSNEDSSTPYGKPLAPTGVVATPGDGQNTLTFNPSAHATSYNFSWKLTSPVAIIDNETVGITSPHVHESLTNGVEVFYIVTALNSRGQSAMSSEVSATPTAPPPIPTGENYNIDNNLISQYLLGGNQ